MRRINIGLLGCGTVGRGFVDLLARERERIRGRDGVDIAVRRILVRDAGKARPGINPALVSTSAIDILDDGCDIIVELVGGIHSAGAFVRRALASGRHVVTANKALLADAGRELFATAARNHVRIGFEASVCGGIPIIRALRHGLAGDRIESISGILNGTCNYILTRMDNEGLSFSEALKEAQALGFAEADPTADVDGYDARAKIAILIAVGLGAQTTAARQLRPNATSIFCVLPLTDITARPDASRTRSLNTSSRS